MKNRMKINESGQSMVTVGAIAVGLFAILVLAIDVGYVYAMRRVAQNAADAGALAGATVLCGTPADADGGHTTAANLAIQAAIQYAGDDSVMNSLNRIFGVNSQDVTASVDLDNAEITVRVDTNFRNFFALFFNQETSDVPAIANAGCFVPGGGLGVIPVAWECREVTSDGALDPKCDIQWREGNECSFGSDPYYVFIDSADLFICDYTPNPPTGAILVDCDVDGDTVVSTPDIRIVNTANPEKGWFWADLTGGCNDTACLTDQVENGYSAPIYPHTWVFGNSGVKIPVFTEIHASHDEDVVILPVFDQKSEGPDPEADCRPNGTNNCDWHAEDTKILSNANSPVKFYFHLISFALLNVKCTEAGNLKGCPGRAFLGPQISPSENSFEGCFVNGYSPGLIGQQGWGNFSTGAWTMYLTR
jgi:hypothetical protein